MFAPVLGKYQMHFKRWVTKSCQVPPRNRGAFGQMVRYKGNPLIILVTIILCEVWQTSMLQMREGFLFVYCSR